jgi:hypothetical protein
LLRPVVHLIATGLAPGRPPLAEGALSAGSQDSVCFGTGSFGRIGYQGPRPVPGHGPHRYFFQLFALGEPLAIAPPRTLRMVTDAMAGKVLARGRLIGLFERLT